MCIIVGKMLKKPALVETVEPDRISLTLEISLGDNSGNHVGNGVNIFDDPNWLLTSDFTVYKIIEDNPSVTIANISTMLGVSERTVQRSIKELKDKGYIKREGSTCGKWVILK